MPPLLRIGHGNGHNEDSLVDYVREVKADSFACLESQRLPLNRIPDTRVTRAGEAVGDVRSRSTAVVTSNRRENLGELVRKASEAIPAFERVAPDRMLAASFYAHPVAKLAGREGIAHFALHPDAGPQALYGVKDDHPIVREYREALETAAVWMKAARKDGLLLVLTGDLQVRIGHDRPWSPRSVLQRPLGLDAWVSEIDWMLTDRALEVASVKTRKLYDHTGFVASLRAA